MMYSTLTANEFPWISAGELVFEINEGLNSGKVIAVQMTRTDLDFNNDGIIDQINVKFKGRRVDKTTGETIFIGDVPIKIQTRIDSIMAGAIAEGQTTIQEWLSDRMDDAVNRVLRHETAIHAINLIPVAPMVTSAELEAAAVLPEDI